MHEIYMDRCLQLAEQGIGHVSPNPMVGCVVVHNGTIIGEGYHKKYGGPHAEVNAIADVKDQALLSESTLYVNLEPCAHWGKTPPCAKLIIEKKIPRVVIGCIDTFSKVAGKGIAMLKDAGITVITGVREKESIFLNRRFFTFHEQHRPYIILKWAQTKDGYIDLLPEHKECSRGFWITNDLCKKLVHRWRTEEDAIMIGTNTALIDNPRLTAREWAGKNPIRVLIDKQLRLPSDLHIFDDEARTIVFSLLDTVNNSQTTEYIIQESIHCLSMLEALHKRNIQSVIIEGGTKLLQSFINQDLWDEARLFTGKMEFKSGIKAPDFNSTNYEKSFIDGVELKQCFATKIK